MDEQIKGALARTDELIDAYSQRATMRDWINGLGKRLKLNPDAVLRKWIGKANWGN